MPWQIWYPWFEIKPIRTYDETVSLKYLQMKAVMYLKSMGIEANHAPLLSNTAMLTLPVGNVYPNGWNICTYIEYKPQIILCS